MNMIAIRTQTHSGIKPERNINIVTNSGSVLSSQSNAWTTNFTHSCSSSSTLPCQESIALLDLQESPSSQLLISNAFPMLLIGM